MTTRHQIVKGFTLEYAKATKRGKGILLDNHCAATGCSRANVRRRVTTEFAKITGKAPIPVFKRRHCAYQPATNTVLTRIWTLTDEPSGKYLAVIIADELEHLERFNDLETYADLLASKLREQRLSMSAATMERYLKPVRDAPYSVPSLSSRKPGPKLYSEIPVRCSGTPMEQAPGFFDVNTVAHCRHSSKDWFLYSIPLTDVFTGWTANLSVKNRAHHNGVAVIEALVRSLPYPMTGLDFGNDGAFINVQLIEWAERHTSACPSAGATSTTTTRMSSSATGTGCATMPSATGMRGPRNWRFSASCGTGEMAQEPPVAHGQGQWLRHRPFEALQAHLRRVAYHLSAAAGSRGDGRGPRPDLGRRAPGVEPCADHWRIKQLQGQLVTRAKLWARANGVEFGEHFFQTHKNLHR